MNTVNKQLRIIPKRRELDVERLAGALLDLVAQLSPDEHERFARLGRQQKSKGGKAPAKGTAVMADAIMSPVAGHMNQASMMGK